MQDLEFRKQLINDENANLKREMAKNQEFIRLFTKRNNELLAQVDKNYTELEEIYNEQRKEINPLAKV